jgi:hypothetical protein
MAPVAIFGILDLELPWKLDVGIWNFGMALLFRKKRTTMQVSVLIILQRSSAAA